MPVQDGQFIVDRYGRRLLNDQGRFMVHDSTAAPCCTGCPWGVSIQGPDHPGDTSVLYNEVDMTQHWPIAYHVGYGGFRVDYAELELSGTIRPETWLSINTVSLPNRLDVGLCAGHEYVDTFCNLVYPSYDNIDQLRTGSYPFVWTNVVMSRRESVQDTVALRAYTRRIRGCDPPWWYANSGLSASITKCRFLSEMPLGVQDSVGSPFIDSGCGEKVVSVPPGIPTICDAHAGVKIAESEHSDLLTVGGSRAWLLYVHQYDSHPGVQMQTMRVSAHGTLAGTRTSSPFYEYELRTVYNTVFGYSMYRTTISPGSTPVYCTPVNWNNTVDHTYQVGFPYGSWYPGLRVYVFLTRSAFDIRLPSYCVIDEIEML